MSYLKTDRKKNQKYNKPWLIASAIFLVLILIGGVFTNRLVSSAIWFKSLLHIQNTDQSIINGDDNNIDYYNAKITALESENESLKKMFQSTSVVSAIASTTNISTSTIAKNSTTTKNGSTTAVIGTSTVTQKNITNISKRKRGSIFAVISRPPFSPYDTLTISGGENNGVLVGDLVFAAPDVIVGTVSVVFPNTSIVTLYSSPDQKQQVYIGSSAVSVESDGFGGGNFHIKIPSETKIKLGDPITWPSMDNILLGKVEKIDSTPGEAFSNILFKLLIPINEIRYVETLHYIN
jgi:cell shape-determining protein MreC